MTDKPSKAFAWTVHDTPIGPLLLAATSVGLVSVGFHAQGRLVQQSVERLGARLDSRAIALSPNTGADGVSGRCGDTSSAAIAGGETIGAATAQLDSYFAGDAREFALPLDWSLASAFPTRVLRCLADTVPYGKVTGYQDLAARVGDPGAARAVGTAMGANPLPVVVPCHRVVESNGGIGGFGGGLEVKRALLALEGVLPQPLFS